MRHLGGTATWIGALAAVTLTLALLGCGGARGISGKCRYGVSRGHNDTEIHCKSRPQPQPAIVSLAASAVPMAHALRLFERSHPHQKVSSVGVNAWGETTFELDTGGHGDSRYRLFNYDRSGHLVSGNVGYVIDHFSRPFPVTQVRPQVLARLVRRLRARQPADRFLRARISVDSFARSLIWQFEVTRGGPSIDYAAFPDGTGLCHGQDHVAGDDLVPAPGVPVCGVSLGLIDFTS